ncbi:galactose-1-phosphate uridylyltransferase [Actinotalea sp.]|uniref:galactose-1-phosphate uridylyltransferase n=1 Tax=Actinotalea sp. TaxID=1872145 RepID=UPI002C8476D9|nr:galactose-1-phosphate uridylyltransferase [Actinotalea sp.]HQY34241.1 galactose-1-phosphate uridylyltransferase [Actinotalea sp.]HRA49483.1 galactose-1-phosphate uridylyltransferase [Actinotalea sp.]
MTSPAVRRTATTLADGRDLIYFDDTEPYVSGAATRRLDDPRPLPHRFAPIPGPDGVERPATGPEMRRDPLTGEWIPMASHRMNRTFLPAADACPLCPARTSESGTAYSDGEVPDTAYDVVVFENRFPALMVLPDGSAEGWDVDGEPLWPARPAAGRCEVVCFSSDHTGSFGGLTAHRVRTIIEAWADRTTVLSALPGIEQVFCFENRGKEIGVTLPHPHGQIYAFPFTTPRTAAMLTQAREYRERTGRHLLSDVVAAERRAGTRIVLETEHWVAYVPAAAKWPVEVHLAPKRDVLDLPGLTDAERDDLAAAYLELLGRLDRFFVEPDDGTPIPLPYIAGWHQAVVGEGRELGRLHLQLFSVLRAPGKLKYLAGVESGLAAWISDTTPERIAAHLQEIR